MACIGVWGLRILNFGRSRVPCPCRPKERQRRARWSSLAPSIQTDGDGQSCISSVILEGGKLRPQEAKGTQEVTSGGARGHPPCWRQTLTRGGTWPSATSPGAVTGKPGSRGLGRWPEVRVPGSPQTGGLLSPLPPRQGRAWHLVLLHSVSRGGSQPLLPPQGAGGASPALAGARTLD